jgi:prephenate dehydratase
MHVMLHAEPAKRRIWISPFASKDKRLVKFKVILTDTPGSLAKAATCLGEENINLLASEARMIKSGESAQWVVVADVTNCKKEMCDICDLLSACGAAKEATCEEFS